MSATKHKKRLMSYANGKSVAELADDLGVTRQTIYRWLRELGLFKGRPRATVNGHGAEAGPKPEFASLAPSQPDGYFKATYPREAAPTAQHAHAGVVSVTANTAAPAAGEILQVCAELANLLIEKNQAYGDSALHPKRIFAKSDPMEQIRVRIDDKLNRLSQGESIGEDTVQDLMGYLVLYRVAQLRAGATAS